MPAPTCPDPVSTSQPVCTPTYRAGPGSVSISVAVDVDDAVDVDVDISLGRIRGAKDEVDEEELE